MFSVLSGHTSPGIPTRTFLQIFKGILYLLAIFSWRFLQDLYILYVWDIKEAIRKQGTHRKSQDA